MEGGRLDKGENEDIYGGWDTNLGQLIVWTVNAEVDQWFRWDVNDMQIIVNLVFKYCWCIERVHAQ